MTDLVELSTDRADDGELLTLRHPSTDEPLEHDGEKMWIRVLGEDSDVLRNKATTIRRKKARQFVRNQQADITTTPEEDLDFLVSATVDWRLFFDGEWIDCTREKKEEIFSKYHWIARQVNQFSGDISNFLASR